MSAPEPPTNPPADLATLGAVLRSLREAQGLTQEQLGFRADMVTAMISRTENGLNDIRFGGLAAWLAALGVGWTEFAKALEAARGGPRPSK